MPRRKDDHLLQLVASAPWPIGILLGVLAFAGVRYGAGWLLAGNTNTTLAALGKALSGDALRWVAWALLAVFWMAAGVSWLRGRHRRHLLKTQTGLDSLRALGWAEFEKLVGETFRHQGFKITETGLGGADGGIDLIMHKSGETVLAQCKQWRNRKVDVRVVREMYGLLEHHHAQRAVIVSLGDYTTDALKFAAGKPIELIHGESLVKLVHDAQLRMKAARQDDVPENMGRPAPASERDKPAHAAPSCPRCGSAMTLRTNRSTGARFFGCTHFPACRGTQPANA